MKKSIFTLALVALFSVAAQAQTPAKKNTKKKTAPVESTTETVNPDGTLSPAPSKTAETEKTEEAPKKSGTRMAINEKGTSSGVKPKGNARAEDKKVENQTTQPGSSPK